MHLNRRLERLEAQRSQSDATPPRVVVYRIGEPLPTLPADGRPWVLLPCNGRDERATAQQQPCA